MTEEQVVTNMELPKKPFYVHNVRSIILQHQHQKISFSKMVELFNEVSANFYKEEIKKNSI